MTERPELNEVVVFNGLTYTWDGVDWRTSDNIILVGNTTLSVSANSTNLSVGNNSVNTSMNTTNFGINGNPLSLIRAWAYVTHSGSVYGISAGQGFQEANGQGSGIVDLIFEDPMLSTSYAVIASISGNLANNVILCENHGRRGTDKCSISFSEISNTGTGATDANFSVMVIGE